MDQKTTLWQRVGSFWRSGWVGKIVTIAVGAMGLLTFCCLSILGLNAILPDVEDTPTPTFTATAPPTDTPTATRTATATTTATLTLAPTRASPPAETCTLTPPPAAPTETKPPGKTPATTQPPTEAPPPKSASSPT